MAKLTAKIAGYEKVVAVPPFNAVMGVNGLLYQRLMSGMTVNTQLGVSDYTLVPGVAGQRLYLNQLFIFSPALTLGWYLRDTANTDVFGSALATLKLSAGGFVLPPSEIGWFATGVGQGLKLTVPTGLAVGSFNLSLAYTQVTP